MANMELIGKALQGIPDCPDTDCILWPGPQSPGGYGRNRRGDIWKCLGTSDVHRQAYLIRHGRDSADGLHVMHLCHNRLCFNVDHLHAGTAAANSQSNRSLDRRALA